MKKLFFVVGTLFILAACNSGKEEAKENAYTPPPKPNKDTIKYYPLQQYFADQFTYLDSTPYGKMKYVTINGKTDSGYIQMPEFKQLAASFAKYDIGGKELKPKFDESLFNDESTESITMSYKCNDKTFPLQSVDVLLNRETNVVKYIMQKKVYTNKDTTFVENLNWNHNHYFTITTSAQVGSKAMNKVVKVVWN
jgi:hypothetical protein